jgi:hypothetical protein
MPTQFSIFLECSIQREQNMKKDEGEVPSEVTKRQLKIGIIVTVIGIPIFYFLLSATEKMPSENADLRMVNGIVGMMYALAPPWFWTLLLLCPLVYEIIRLSIQYARQKREEKMEIEEE